MCFEGPDSTSARGWTAVNRTVDETGRAENADHSGN